MDARPTFDTADYERRLRTAGIDPEHAAAHREALTTALDTSHSDLATKAHLDALETRLDAKLETKFAAMDAKLDLRFASLEARFATYDERFKSQSFETQAVVNAMGIRLSEAMRVQTLGLIGAVAAIVGIATAVIKLFP